MIDPLHISPDACCAAKQAIALVVSHQEDLQAVISRTKARISKNAATKADYTRLGALLSERAQRTGCLKMVINNTTSPRTYAKRVSAARSYVLERVFRCIQNLAAVQYGNNPSEHAQLRLIGEDLAILMPLLKQLRNTIETGFTGVRAKRKSKRLALSGLQKTWREQLCRRAALGKYCVASLVAAATGCRPAELVFGVAIWQAFDHEEGIDCLYLHVKGAKVRRGHGQPERRIVFGCNNQNEIVQNLVNLTKDGGLRTVSIEHAGNFTTEIRRLAAELWPEHPLPVTASCFRHQIAADLKKCGFHEMASKLLGHRTAKTIRHYGTAAQGKTMIVPLRVEVFYPVKSLDHKRFSPAFQVNQPECQGR